MAEVIRFVVRSVVLLGAKHGFGIQPRCQPFHAAHLGKLLGMVRVQQLEVWQAVHRPGGLAVSRRPGGQPPSSEAPGKFEGSGRECARQHFLHRIQPHR